MAVEYAKDKFMMMNNGQYAQHTVHVKNVREFPHIFLAKNISPINHPLIFVFLWGNNDYISYYKRKYQSILFFIFPYNKVTVRTNSNKQQKKGRVEANDRM